MARLRKSDREAVERAISQEWETVEEAAEAAILALDLSREKWLKDKSNRPYMILMQDTATKAVYTYGPYATEAKASKAFRSLAAPNDGYVGGVMKLYEIPEDEA